MMNDDFVCFKVFQVCFFVCELILSTGRRRSGGGVGPEVRCGEES